MNKFILLLLAIPMLAAGCNFTPNNQVDLVSLQNTCKEWGASLKANNVINKDSIVYIHYNNSVKQCLVESITLNQLGGSYSSSWDIIYDGESGKQLLSYNTESGPTFFESAFDHRPVNGVATTNPITPSEFRELKNQLMSQ